MKLLLLLALLAFAWAPMVVGTPPTDATLTFAPSACTVLGCFACFYDLNGTLLFIPC